MSEASKAATEYERDQMNQGGVWCVECMQRRGDPRNHFLAGARALLEWARSKAKEPIGVIYIDHPAVFMSDLEAYFAEEKK